MTSNVLQQIQSGLSDAAYAETVAQWFDSSLENSHELLEYVLDFLSSDLSAEEFLEEHPNPTLDGIQLPLPDYTGVTEGVLVHVSDIIEGLDQDKDYVSTVSYEQASKWLDDYTTSLAASNAAITALHTFANDVTANVSEFVSAITARLGGISDSMLDFTSSIIEVLRCEGMTMKEKIQNIFYALGWSKGLTPGINLPVNAVSEYTGATGITAGAGIIAEAAQNFPSWCVKLATKVVGIVDSIFDGVGSKLIRFTQEQTRTMFAYGDAYTTKEKGEWTDKVCDNATTYFLFDSMSIDPSDGESAFGQIFDDKFFYTLRNQRKCHLYVSPFCTIDVWSLSMDQTIHNCNMCMALHWKPVCMDPFFAAIPYFSGIGVDECKRRFVSGTIKFSDIVEQVASMCRDQDGPIQANINKLTYLGSNAGVDAFDDAAWPGYTFNYDVPLTLGIMMSQAVFFGLLKAQYFDQGVDDAGTFDTMIASHNMLTQVQIYQDTVNKKLLLGTNTAAYFTGAMRNAVVNGIATELEGVSGSWKDFLYLFPFLRDIFESAFQFKVLDNGTHQNDFIPYFWTASDVPGKWSINNDEAIASIVTSGIKVAAIVVATIFAIKAFKSIRKKLFTARAKVDLLSFDDRMLSDTSFAESVYKQNSRVALAESAYEKIIGTAKGSISKVKDFVGNAISSVRTTVTGLLSGDDSDASSGSYNIKKLEKLITG